MMTQLGYDKGSDAVCITEKSLPTGSDLTIEPYTLETRYTFKHSAGKYGGESASGWVTTDHLTSYEHNVPDHFSQYVGKTLYIFFKYDESDTGSGGSCR